MPALPLRHRQLNTLMLCGQRRHQRRHRALERDWCAARDDACFRALLKSHRLSRLQALRHLRRGYALALQPASVPTLANSS